jgi:hypothetical protein
MVVPVIVVPVIVVPVVGPPRAPVGWVIPVVPVRPPNNIPGMVNIADHRPGCNFIIGGCDHLYISPVGLPGVARIGRFGVDRFDDIVTSVQRLVANQLDLNSTVTQFFNYKNGNVLLLILVQGGTKHNGMHFSVWIVCNSDVIDVVIAVQVQVVDRRLLIIQTSLKFFEGLRLLEQVHHGVEVQVVSRQTKILIGIVLGSNGCRCGEQNCYTEYGSYCFHGVQLLLVAFDLSTAKAVPKKGKMKDP